MIASISARISVFNSSRDGRPVLDFVGLTEEEFLEVTMSHKVTPYVHDPAETKPGEKTPDFDRWNRDGAIAREDAAEMISRWRAREGVDVSR